MAASKISCNQSLQEPIISGRLLVANWQCLSLNWRALHDMSVSVVLVLGKGTWLYEKLLDYKVIWQKNASRDWRNLPGCWQRSHHLHLRSYVCGWCEPEVQTSVAYRWKCLCTTLTGLLTPVIRPLFFFCTSWCSSKHGNVNQIISDRGRRKGGTKTGDESCHDDSHMLPVKLRLSLHLSQCVLRPWQTLFQVLENVLTSGIQRQPFSSALWQVLSHVLL